MEALFKDAVAPLTDFVQAHAEWGGPIVFAICFLESVAIVSAFIPATILLIGIGSLATAGLLDLGELSAWGIVGSGLGTLFAFLVFGGDLTLTAFSSILPPVPPQR